MRGCMRMRRGKSWLNHDCHVWPTTVSPASAVFRVAALPTCCDEGAVTA